MSDEVILALIAMVQSWGNSLFANLAAVTTAAAAGIIAFLTWRNNAKAAERAEEIKVEMVAVKNAAVLSNQQAEDIATGRERKGYVNGIKTGQERASDLGALAARFSPDRTDVFMAKPDGPDHNDQR